jgi:hypothetical protein
MTPLPLTSMSAGAGAGSTRRVTGSAGSEAQRVCGSTTVPQWELQRCRVKDIRFIGGHAIRCTAVESTRGFDITPHAKHRLVRPLIQLGRVAIELLGYSGLRRLHRRRSCKGDR